MIKRKFLFLLIGLHFTVLFSSAQALNVPLSNPANLEILNYNESQAKDFASKNLNRFAVERLQKYNYLLDSLYSSERKDTLAQIEGTYRLSSVSKKSIIDTLNSEISSLSTQNKSLDTLYTSLVRNAILSFALWLAIVLLIIQFRKIRLKKVNAKLQTTNNQLKPLEVFSKKAEMFVNDFKKLKDPIQLLYNEFTKLKNVVDESGLKENASPEWSAIAIKCDQLAIVLEKEEKILIASLSQAEVLKETKVTTDINNLCEQYLEMAIRGIPKSDEFNYQITRDFEKKIAPIHVNAAAIGSLLLNVLTNAFQSVWDQNLKGIKGYQPKISISSRILPRFLQIRIKDNGTGINESILKNISDEFYTTRPPETGPGLGLFTAINIIQEMHKGEIKIESEEGASTDVYIKFFI